MATFPSDRMFSQRPPSAEESYQRLVARSAEVSAEIARLEERFPRRLPSKASLDRGLAMAAAAPAVAAPMDLDRPHEFPRMRLDEIFATPENQVFKVVFFPDRIFHAQYLNASRANERYRYTVSDARSVLDASALKARVFLDGAFLAEVLRIEYRGSRLTELARQHGRFLRDEIIAWVKLEGKITSTDTLGNPMLDASGKPMLVSHSVEQPVKLHYCPWINAYQVEIWSTLEAPSEASHDFQVRAQMGPTASITRVRNFIEVIEQLNELEVVELAFRENDINLPYGTPIDKPEWDNNYERSFQYPHSPIPSNNAANTVPVGNYRLPFQKGWYLDANKVAPVRYRNAMMDTNSGPEYKPQLPGEQIDWSTAIDPRDFKSANVIEMRWLLQRELGGSVVFFHEVTIPSGTVEGTHQHVGSEELYYIVSGEGEAYMAVGDDPSTSEFPKVVRPIYGLFEKECVAVPVKPGNVIFTKSGGIHGIKNTGDQPLKFVAFLYHSV